MSATGAARPRPRAADDAKAVVLLAVLGALLLGYGAYRNAFVPGVHPANVVHPGAQGPSAAAILEDFPDDPTTNPERARAVNSAAGITPTRR